MKSVDAIRLQDINFPQKILKSFSGPKYGIDGIRKIMGIKLDYFGFVAFVILLIIFILGEKKKISREKKESH